MPYRCPNCHAPLTQDSIESVEEFVGTQTMQERPAFCLACGEPFAVTTYVHARYELVPYPTQAWRV